MPKLNPLGKNKLSGCGVGVVVAVFVDVLVGGKGVCVSVRVAVGVEVRLGVNVNGCGEMVDVAVLFTSEVSMLVISLTILSAGPEQEETSKKQNKIIGYNIFIRTLVITYN